MSEKKEILICSRCNTAVSIPLLVDEDVQDIGPMIWDDSVIIDTGHAWRIENSNNLHKKKQQETWFSHTSLVDSVVYDDSSIGCCGYYGRKNTRCSCGNIIGGRYDECAHMNRFEPNIKLLACAKRIAMWPLYCSGTYCESGAITLSEFRSLVSASSGAFLS